LQVGSRTFRLTGLKASQGTGKSILSIRH